MKMRDTWRPWLIALAVIASICYASFPLALILNPPRAFTGFVSFLSQFDQPYSWLFSELDVVSAVVSTAILIVILYRYSVTNRLSTWALWLAILNGLGTLGAALVPLPDNFRELGVQAALKAWDPQVIFHGVASFVNSAAFVVAAILWAWASRRKPGFGWRASLAVIIVLLSTVGFAIGEWYPATSPAIQRLFIFGYMIWFIVFIIDLTRSNRRKKVYKSS